jgi:hypothetical protein
MKVEVLFPQSIKVSTKGQNFVTLTTDKGMPYYIRATNGEPFFIINLPTVGTYNLNTTLIKRCELINYAEVARTIDLPQAERTSGADSTSISFVGGIGKTPARIFHTAGKIEINKNYITKYGFESQMFILFHEKGHIFYKTEWKCDLYAFKMFLEHNFNPSQAMVALTRVMSKIQNPKTIADFDKNDEIDDRMQRLLFLCTTTS